MSEPQTNSTAIAGSSPVPCSAFDKWCRNLGWQVIKTAMEGMEKDLLPTDSDLADIVRNACNDYVSEKVMLDMQNR